LSRVAVAGAVVGILIAGFVLLWDLAEGAVGCGEDTSYCAQSQDKNGTYTGQLLLDGKPYADQAFEVAFESRDQADLGRVAFTTTTEGQFCIVWALERITPFAYTPTGQPLEESTRGIQGLSNWQPLDGLPPDGCQEGDGGIPWYRADGLTRTWEYAVLLIVPALAGFLMISGVFHRREPRARRRVRFGWAAVGLSVGLLWFLASSHGWIALT